MKDRPAERVKEIKFMRGCNKKKKKKKKNNIHIQNY